MLRQRRHARRARRRRTTSVTAWRAASRRRARRPRAATGRTRHARRPRRTRSARAGDAGPFAVSRVMVRSTPCSTTRSGMPSFAQPATSSKAGPTMRTRCPPLTRQRCASTARQNAPMSVAAGDGASGLVHHASCGSRCHSTSPPCTVHIAAVVQSHAQRAGRRRCRPTCPRRDSPCACQRTGVPSTDGACRRQLLANLVGRTARQQVDALRRRTSSARHERRQRAPAPEPPRGHQVVERDHPRRDVGRRLRRDAGSRRCRGRRSCSAPPSLAPRRGCPRACARAALRRPTSDGRLADGRYRAHHDVVGPLQLDRRLADVADGRDDGDAGHQRDERRDRRCRHRRGRRSSDRVAAASTGRGRAPPASARTRRAARDRRSARRR